MRPNLADLTLSRTERDRLPLSLPCDNCRQANLIANFFEAAGLAATVVNTTHGWQTVLEQPERLAD